MKLATKIIIGIIDTGMILLLILVLYILFTPIGFYYLVILYSGLGVVLLNTVRLIIMIKNGRKSIIFYFPYLTIFFITFYAFFGYENYLMARLLAIINCLLILFVAYDLWQPNNLGHLMINKMTNKIIEYFSVDLESKGWTENKKES